MESSLLWKEWVLHKCYHGIQASSWKVAFPVLSKLDIHASIKKLNINPLGTSEILPDPSIWSLHCRRGFTDLRLICWKWRTIFEHKGKVTPTMAALPASTDCFWRQDRSLIQPLMHLRRVCFRKVEKGKISYPRHTTKEFQSKDPTFSDWSPSLALTTHPAAFFLLGT